MIKNRLKSYAFNQFLIKNNQKNQKFIDNSD
jgi:hypothetical protein